MTAIDAQRIAREHDLDLVEVAPTAMPPVCRLMDYGRYRYEQSKRERQARKNQHVSSLREIRLRPKIDEHDVDFKTRTAQKFLEDGDKVKVSVLFRGREVTHPRIGLDLLQRVSQSLSEVASVEKPASMEGRLMTMILTPTNKQAGKSKEKQES